MRRNDRSKIATSSEGNCLNLTSIREGVNVLRARELKAANDAATKLRQLYMSVEGLNEAAEAADGVGGLDGARPAAC